MGRGQPSGRSRVEPRSTRPWQQGHLRRQLWLGQRRAVPPRARPVETVPELHRWFYVIEKHLFLRGSRGCRAACSGGFSRQSRPHDRVGDHRHRLRSVRGVWRRAAEERPDQSGRDRRTCAENGPARGACGRCEFRQCLTAQVGPSGRGRGRVAGVAPVERYGPFAGAGAYDLGRGAARSGLS